MLVGLRLCSEDLVEDKRRVEELFFFLKDLYEYVVVVEVVVVVFCLYCYILYVLEKLLVIYSEVMWYLFIEVKGEFKDLNIFFL